MLIEKHKVVAISYTLTVDGEIVDRADEGQPLDYIQGCHMLIPGLELALQGHEAGQRLHVSVAPADAYGEYDPGSRFDIPKSSFEVDGHLREDLLVVGRTIPMLNSEGAVCHARIMEIGPDKVNVDFNHPFAGKTLEFEVEVLSVRNATKKELDEGLHGEFLPHGDGCCHGKCHSGGHKGDGGCCHENDGEGCCHGSGGCHHDDVASARQD